MKKLVLMFVAVAAISFASCGNKTAAPEAAVDSVIDSTIVDSAAVDSTLDSAAAVIDSAAAVVDSVVAQ